MLTPLVFCWMFVGAASFDLLTEELVTAVRGRNISLPCSFSVPVVAVYWYRHEFSGSTDDEAMLIGRDFLGFTDPIPGFERFRIGDDYRLVITDVSVLDETTYSCLVVPHQSVDQRGYTDLRVIALANPQEPMISSCESTGPGTCTYIIGEDEEGITLDCNLYNARPPASLMWTIGDDSVKISADQQIREKDGLSNTSSQLWVSRTEMGETFVCIATGESVDGTSTLVATLATAATGNNEKERGLSSGGKSGIAIITVVIVITVATIFLRHLRTESRKQLRDSEELVHLIRKTVTRASLGRTANLGALYDIRTDTFQNDSLFALKPGSHRIKITDLGETVIEVTTSDSFQEKCDKLNIEAELQMSLLAEMVTLGSGAYLQHQRKNARTQSMSLIYQLKTVNETVLLSDKKMKKLRDTLSATNLDATHVVVGIDWGGHCTVTCEYENNESYDVSKIKSEMSEELKKLEDALIGKTHTTADTQEGGKTEFSFRCRGDLPAADKDKPILYDGAVGFARSLRPFVQNTNEGKGVPVTYYAMPLENVNKELIYKEVDEGIVKETARLLETINARTQKVNAIRHDMESNKAFISYEGLSRIREKWNEVTAEKSHCITDLRKVVKGVRSGENKWNTLAEFLGYLRAEDMLPSNYDNEFEPYLKKVELVKSYLGKNIKFIGKDDKLVTDSKQNTYVLYVPQYSNVKVEEKNRKLFLRLSSTFSSNETCGFIVVYQEIVPSHVWPHEVRGPTIKKYVQGTCECEDLYEEMGQPLEGCMIHMENPVLVTSIPKDRAFVKLRCPNAITKPGNCAGVVSEWRCSECKQLVEYGMTTKLFYCSCGQSNPGDSQYRCNDLHHSIHFIVYPEDQLISELSELKAMKEMNILILGETGVGKSTWINSLQNYGSFASFTEAMDSQRLHVLIPSSFSITQGGKSKSIKLKIQVSDNMEKTGRLTKIETRSYVVNIDDMRLCLINTPSISDYGHDGDSLQPKTWRKEIMAYLTSYSEIHAICIILKPNNTQLTKLFRSFIEEFLAHLHNSVKNNIVFCFTNTRSTFYQPGDTLVALNEELRRIKVGIQATKDNYFCFDNEPFRFLACTKEGVTFGDEEATNCSSSWDNSVEETRRLLNYIGSRVKPHKVKETTDVSEACIHIKALSKVLVERAIKISPNLDATKEAKAKNSCTKSYSEKELDIILQAGAKFDSFLKANLIKCREPFVENLEIFINQEKRNSAHLRKPRLLNNMLKQKMDYTEKRKVIEKITGENIPTLADINELQEKLFKLYH